MPMDIHQIACVGAGLIGQGWATLFSSKGFEVILHDVDESILEKSAKGVRSNLMFLEANRFLKPGEAEASLKRIKMSTRMSEAVRHADYVQESTLDQYEIKKQVFKEMDVAAPDHAILASSSSGLLMTEIQKATMRPQRCVLVHPVLPLYLIPLIEIAGGDKTSRETMMAAYDFMKRLEKSLSYLSGKSLVILSIDCRQRYCVKPSILLTRMWRVPKRWIKPFVWGLAFAIPSLVHSYGFI